MWVLINYIILEEKDIYINVYANNNNNSNNNNNKAMKTSVSPHTEALFKYLFKGIHNFFI